MLKTGSDSPLPLLPPYLSPPSPESPKRLMKTTFFPLSSPLLPGGFFPSWFFFLRSLSRCLPFPPFLLFLSGHVDQGKPGFVLPPSPFSSGFSFFFCSIIKEKRLRLSIRRGTPSFSPSSPFFFLRPPLSSSPSPSNDLEERNKAKARLLFPSSSKASPFFPFFPPPLPGLTRKIGEEKDYLPPVSHLPFSPSPLLLSPPLHRIYIW